MARPEIGDRQRVVEVGVAPLRAARLPPHAQVPHPGEVGHERRRLDERADAPQLVARRASRGRRTAAPRPPWDGSDRAARAGTWSCPRRWARAARTPARARTREGEVVDREHARAEALRQPDDLDDRLAVTVDRTVGGLYGGHGSERTWVRCVPAAPHDGRTLISRARGSAASADAQRRRVYLAETPLPSSPLPGLAACAGFVDQVVGSLWWHERFPERDLGAVPRLRPGQRRPPGLLPRGGRPGPRSRCRAATARRRSCSTSSRTGRSASTPVSLTTVAPSPACCSTRSTEFCGPERGAALAESYREHGVHVGAPAAARARRPAALRLGRTAAPRQGSRAAGVVRRPTTAHGRAHRGCFEGYERGSSVLRFADGTASTTATCREAVAAA